MNRRGFLKLILATGCAPAIVKAANLMAIPRAFEYQNGVLVPKTRIATADELVRGNWQKDGIYYESSTGLFYDYEGVDYVNGQEVDSPVYVGKGTAQGFTPQVQVWDKLPDGPATEQLKQYFGHWYGQSNQEQIARFMETVK